jgi:hypothetical protein
MKRIRAGIEFGEGSYRNLLPVVEFLQRRGNHLVTDGFIDSQDGLYCQFEKPIDFDALQRVFEFDERVALNSTDDEIFDRTTWVAIYGPTNSNIVRSREHAKG